MINGTVNGTTPDPRKHTSPYPKGRRDSYGVVLINGNDVLSNLTPTRAIC
jgi:hypothetical protein